MKRIAFTLIGGKAWVGGYNYQINLFSALSCYEHKRVQPVLFLGLDVDQEILTSFQQIPQIEVVQSEVFNQNKALKRLLKSAIFGRDNAALSLFMQHKIDVVFEVANFYGWRFPIPVIAWIPDLQHRKLPQFFSMFSFWKRELGFRAQILSHRIIMLSSEDALVDFNRYYPILKGKAHVVNFAVPAKISHTNLQSVLKSCDLPKHFFFMPNQFWRHKNHECVIRALKICQDRGKNIVVAVSGKQVNTGDGSYFLYLKQQIEVNNLESNFRLLNIIPYQDILSLMLACDALINPSKFEGWSTTVEEAKSFGVEMILSNLNVHREQAQERAHFFDSNAPEALANILCEFKVKDTILKSSIQAAAIKNSFGRVEFFAKNFADLVVFASNSNRLKS